ncbi:hypothetical protein ES332_A02G116800v1 [Gossypium tomentosum]|uniref:Uncharacterized protein n=1 Tax=Gossypium tomentosum TaxID=34277 RepID=A0A5D2RG11_GOSTO|nr:hypothetical protein ES332_A02G116800v1 [Gossypium tomentosum]
MEEQKGRKQHRAKMEGTAGGAEAGSHSKRPRTDPERHKLYREIKNKASMELMEQTVVHIMAHLGLNCTSFKKMEEWFLAQEYVGDHQGSATVTANFQTSTADFCQPMALGQYQTSIAASTAAGSSFSAGVWINCAARSPFGTNDILSEYGDPNNIGNHFGSDLAGGPDYTSIVASSAAAGTSSAPPNGHGVWIKSDAANYDSCEFGVPNNEDFLCRDFCL